MVGFEYRITPAPVYTSKHRLDAVQMGVVLEELFLPLLVDDFSNFRVCLLASPIFEGPLLLVQRRGHFLIIAGRNILY